MLIARGDATVFVTRPISGVLLAIFGSPARDCAAADDPSAPRRVFVEE